MTIPDNALVATAAVALTAAAMLVAFHAYLRSYRRTLATVRAQRNRWWREARDLRADRPATHRSLARHAAQAVALTEPIPYTVADRTAFEGDNTVVAEYAQLADAARKIRQGGR